MICPECRICTCYPLHPSSSLCSLPPQTHTQPRPNHNHKYKSINLPLSHPRISRRSTAFSLDSRQQRPRPVPASEEQAGGWTTKSSYPPTPPSSPCSPPSLTLLPCLTLAPSIGDGWEVEKNVAKGGMWSVGMGEDRGRDNPRQSGKWGACPRRCPLLPCCTTPRRFCVC